MGKLSNFTRFLEVENTAFLKNIGADIVQILNPLLWLVDKASPKFSSISLSWHFRNGAVWPPPSFILKIHGDIECVASKWEQVWNEELRNGSFVNHRSLGENRNHDLPNFFRAYHHPLGTAYTHHKVYSLIAPYQWPFPSISGRATKSSRRPRGDLSSVLQVSQRGSDQSPMIRKYCISEKHRCGYCPNFESIVMASW